MSALPRRTARVLTRSFPVFCVVILSLAGCSAEGKPGPQGSPGSAASSGTSGQASDALKDQSAAVLAWTPPAPVAKTEGKLGDRFIVRPPTVPSTAEIISVQAGDVSTILTWQLSSVTDNGTAGFTLNITALLWPDAVRLVDPVGKKSYGVNTMTVPGKDFDKTYCACSRYPTHVGPDPVRMTSSYPPLPPDVTSVSVRIPYFAPVTVPVTR